MNESFHECRSIWVYLIAQDGRVGPVLFEREINHEETNGLTNESTNDCLLCGLVIGLEMAE